MKTIKTIAENSQYWKRLAIGTLLRVRDEDAKKVVDNKEAGYVTKQEWKQLRDQEQETNKEANNAKKIKVLSGGGFPEREVNSLTIGSLREELGMASGSTVAVNGTGVTDDYQLQDGDIVAAVTSNKTGGLKVMNFMISK